MWSDWTILPRKGRSFHAGHWCGQDPLHEQIVQGGPGGGYIFGTAHNLLPDVPTENVIALVEAYHKYGAY